MDAIFRARPVTDIVLTLAGPIAWAAHFMFLYFIQSMICAAGANRPDFAFGIVAWLLTAIALAGIVAGLYVLRNRTTTQNDGIVFLQKISLALGLLSAVAICWTMFPTTMLPACPA